MAPTTVLVSGASGFIALHILNVLLSKGFRVIGTVRSQEKADKIISQFKELYPNGDLSFEVVKDIATEDAFDHVLQKHPEITEVLHTASPFAFGFNKSCEDAYLKPATIGTKNILTATKKYSPQVKNVVVTSSYAAIANRDKVGDPTFIHTEETWNPIEWSDVQGDEIKAYSASKKLAEVVARDFVKEEKPAFKLHTVNPPFVLGPQMFSEALVNPKLNTSAEHINSLFKVKPDFTDYLSAPAGLSADVRDVANLHVLPLVKDLPSGSRMFTCQGVYTGQTLLNDLHKFFPELDGIIGKGEPEGASEKAQVKMPYFDTSATEKLTGMTWTPQEVTVKDSIKQILDYKKSHGQIKL